jgi:hypothetical protein
MNRRILGFGVVFLSVFLAAPILAAEIQQTMPSMDGPVITQAFASATISPGETWKVYLNASHPNGGMKNIFAVVRQPGAGEYPMSIIGIKEESQKVLSGYIYLVPSAPWKLLEFVNIYLTVWIQDKSGNFSEPAILALSFRSRESQEAPPQGVFKELELGAIMVKLKSSPRG